MEITYGVYEHLDAEIYHAHAASSNSSLKTLPDDPETYWAYNIADPKPAWARRIKEASRVMELGTIFHSWLLEEIKPAIANNCCALLSSGKRKGEPCSNAGTLEEAGTGLFYCGTHAKGRIVTPAPLAVTREEYEDLEYGRDRCYADPEIRAFLETKRRNELSLFWNDQETSEPCRGRIDCLCEFSDGLWILDLKRASCDPNVTEAVGWKIFDMGYENAAAMYWDATEELIGPVVGYSLLFCRNSPPFDAALWHVSENDIDMGRRHYHEKLRDLRDRRASGNWRNLRFGDPGYTQLPRKAWDREIGVAPVAFDEFSAFSGE